MTSQVKKDRSLTARCGLGQHLVEAQRSCTLKVTTQYSGTPSLDSRFLFFGESCLVFLCPTTTRIVPRLTVNLTCASRRYSGQSIWFGTSACGGAVHMRHTDASCVLQLPSFPHLSDAQGLWSQRLLQIPFPYAIPTTIP